MQILSPQTNSTSKSYNFVTILLPTGSIHFSHSYYRPQTKFAKVMFLQVSVCPHGGGMRGCSQGGHAWFALGGHA